MRERLLRRSRVAGAILAAVLVLGGCASDPTGQAVWRPFNALITDPNPGVRGPAAVGACVFVFPGVPVAVALLPVTVPITLADTSAGGASMATIAPLMFVSQIGAILFGGLPWLAVHGGRE